MKVLDKDQMSFYSIESMKYRQFLLSYTEAHMAHNVYISRYIVYLKKKLLHMETEAFKVTNYTILVIIFFFSIFFFCFHTRGKI